MIKFKPISDSRPPSFDMGEVILSPWKDGSVVGTDVGLESFATFSNGEKIANPRFFQDEEKELARVQRKLSKAPKGTPERKKAIRVVERVHGSIANRRNDFANQVSHQLVDRYGVIVFEDLDIRNMLKNHCLAKAIEAPPFRTGSVYMLQEVTYRIEPNNMHR